jgi:hypothetical protein
MSVSRPAEAPDHATGQKLLVSEIVTAEETTAVQLAFAIGMLNR